MAQCEFFGGRENPEKNKMCISPAKPREFGTLCFIHNEAFGQDPEDWSEEVLSGSGATPAPAGSTEQTRERESVVGWRGYREDGNGSRLLLD